jgi:hypothetical protein
MTTTELYAKAYESGRKEDWEAYFMASRKQQIEAAKLPTIKYYKDSLDEEWDEGWEGLNSIGRPLNIYPKHRWGE